MPEQLIILQGLQELVGQLMLITGAICILILGTIAVLLFANDRNRARGYQLNCRRKLGYETLPETAPASRLWDRITGRHRISLFPAIYRRTSDSCQITLKKPPC